MELQRLSLASLNLNKPLSTRKPTASASSSARKLWSSVSDGVGRGSPVAEGDQVSSQAEVLISVSSTVADSSGIDLSSSRLSFAVDEDTGETVINIVDNDSGEVIRQIPSDDILKLKKKMVEMQGLLLDQRV